ncbi:multicopper oxidase domain-containing protein [Alkalihalobacillus macyae]|uniref:multicopper oxidase family protein n=1 Tax=Guptibacillus hwajinpoensis TaxID=208199 RepID=UPI00273BF1AC|nr:multicopper oxidase domain-containing protein [Alkalihalobacillus macyae]MDP4552313.1 multicopper oxidase domain-containing protein [Alkalihalobacillus macyae]
MLTPDNNQLFGEIKDGVKHFVLTAEPVKQEVLDGIYIEGWGYNGSIPGPTLVVNPRDEVSIRVYNELPEATSVHWHGMDIHENVDGGVELQSSPSIKPGDYVEYNFTINNPPGTHMYHTHVNSMKQLMMGLGGGLIIKEKDDEINDDYFLLLQEFAVKNIEHGELEKGTYPINPHSHSFNFYTINGRCFPDLSHLETKHGEKVRIRFGSLGHGSHPMHIHGHQFIIETQDGNPLPDAMKMNRNSVALASGETFDLMVNANNPGTWPLHCHSPHHMSNNGTEGHGGMMTALKYK